MAIEGDRPALYKRRETELNIQMARTFRELRPLSPVQTYGFIGGQAVSKYIECAYHPVDLSSDIDGNKGSYKATLARRYYISPQPRRTENGGVLPRDFIYGIAETALAVTVRPPLEAPEKPRPIDYFLSDRFDINTYLDGDIEEDLQQEKTGVAEFKTYRYTNFAAHFNPRRQPPMIRERRRFYPGAVPITDGDFIEQHQTFQWLDLILKSRSQR